jgi:hypothetical protein
MQNFWALELPRMSFHGNRCLRIVRLYGTELLSSIFFKVHKHLRFTTKFLFNIITEDVQPYNWLKLNNYQLTQLLFSNTDSKRHNWSGIMIKKSNIKGIHMAVCRAGGVNILVEIVSYYLSRVCFLLPCYNITIR